MQSKVMSRTAALLGLVSGVAMLAQAPLAAAQNSYSPQDQQGYQQGPPQQGYDNQQGPQQGYDQQGDDQGQGEPAPPQGSYAPPPPGYEQSGSTYEDQAQDQDREYADRYSQWAAQNCVNQRNNTAAGAVIGGVLGAVIGSNLSGRHNRTGGAIVGGALGATAGASVGANASGGGACPPGYVIRGGAPAFAYGGPAYYGGPGWYNPWVFVGGRYVYHPYRYWYWNHRNYWKPGYRAKPWKYRHGRW